MEAMLVGVYGYGIIHQHVEAVEYWVTLRWPLCEITFVNKAKAEQVNEPVHV